MRFSNEVHDEQKTRKFWFLFCNNFNFFCIFRHRMEFSRVADGGIIDCDIDIGVSAVVV